MAVLTDDNPHSAIRQARSAAGLSQEKLAQLAECSTAYVRVLERGYLPARPADAPAYTRVLAVLNGESQPRPAGSRDAQSSARHGEG